MNYLINQEGVSLTAPATPTPATHVLPFCCNTLARWELGRDMFWKEPVLLRKVLGICVPPMRLYYVLKTPPLLCVHDVLYCCVGQGSQCITV